MKKIFSMKEPEQTQHLICCWNRCCIGINLIAECLYIYFMLDDPLFLRVGLFVFFLSMGYVIWQFFNPHERFFKMAYFGLAAILTITALCSIQFFAAIQHPLSWIIPLALVLLESLVAVCIHHRYHIYRYFKKNKK